LVTVLLIVLSVWLDPIQDIQRKISET